MNFRSQPLAQFQRVEGDVASRMGCLQICRNLLNRSEINISGDYDQMPDTPVRTVNSGLI